MPHEQQHYWTGSEWLAGDKMQVPESGQTRLFSVATTSGWRVELGDPTYPIRYWDGTETNFTVDSNGDIVGRSITLYPNFGGTAGAVTVDAAGAGTNVHAFSFIDNTGGERWYIKAGAGEMLTDAYFRMYSNFSDSFYKFQINPSGGSLSWGDGTVDVDVTLFRSAADELALFSSDSFAWSAGQNSKLHSSGYIQLAEMTAPAAPAADQGRLYLEDNGAGKTRLVVKFSSGAAQVIATQP